VESNKQLLLEHREQLKRMIEACKALHEGFEDQRKEVKAEKMKKIRHAISNGISDGVSDGISNGISDGISNGLSNGISDGISNGISDGILVGIFEYCSVYMTE
jgi:hypothetical protein